MKEMKCDETKSKCLLRIELFYLSYIGFALSSNFCDNFDVVGIIFVILFRAV